MLDPAFVRDNIEGVRTGLRNRGLDPDKTLEEIATLETVRRRLIPELEGLKRQQNTSGDEIARAKRMGKDTSGIQDTTAGRFRVVWQPREMEGILLANPTHGPRPGTSIPWRTRTSIPAPSAG